MSEIPRSAKCKYCGFEVPVSTAEISETVVKVTVACWKCGRVYSWNISRPSKSVGAEIL